MFPVFSKEKQIISANGDDEWGDVSILLWLIDTVQEDSRASTFGQ